MGKRETQAAGVDLVKVIARVASYHPDAFAEAVYWDGAPVWKRPEDRLAWVGSQVLGMLTDYATDVSETMIELVCAEVDTVALGTWYLKHYR